MLMIRQPRFEGLLVRSTWEEGIRWDVRGPVRKQTYRVDFHDSLYPVQGSRQHATPLGADEIRIEAPFSEGGLHGTEIITLKSARLGQEADKLTGKALLKNETLKKADPALEFFRKARPAGQENRISVPEELGKQLTGMLPKVIRDILAGDDVRFVSAQRTIDAQQSRIVSPPREAPVRPMTPDAGRRQWARHKEHLLTVLDQVTRSGSAKFVENVDTVEKRWKLLFWKSRDTKTNIFNTIACRGEVNAFQGVYAGKR